MEIDQALVEMYEAIFESDLSNNDIWVRLKSVAKDANTKRLEYKDLLDNRAFTVDMAGRWYNSQILSETVCILTFLSMLDAAVGKDYSTATEAYNDQLYLTDFMDLSVEFEIIGGCRHEISNAYTTAISVLSDIELQLPRVEDLEVYDIPASVLAYQLYDSHDKTHILVNLNIDKNPVLFTDEVQILKDV